MYLALKHIHLTLIAISLLLFLLRSFWLLTGSAHLHKKLFRILPHPVNLFMILSGFAVLYSLGLPMTTPWILAKLMALVIYIGFGLIAFKQKTASKQMAFISAALLTFVYIVSVAVTKSPMGVLGDF
jgi:uncharacterized membrane protein SirB2